MRSGLNFIIITALFCVATFSVNAQATEPVISASHMQAAENFLVAMSINTQFQLMTEGLINTAGNQIPEAKRAAFIDVMKKFMAKYYTWDIVKPHMAKIYAQEFDETELKQLADFYGSPIGKKYSAKLSSLTQKGMLMGQQIVAEHKPELQAMMEEAMK